MRKLLALSLASLLTLSVSACSGAGPVKDGKCVDSKVGGGALPGMIDPDCGSASPAK